MNIENLSPLQMPGTSEYTIRRLREDPLSNEAVLSLFLWHNQQNDLIKSGKTTSCARDLALATIYRASGLPDLARETLTSGMELAQFHAPFDLPHYEEALEALDKNV